MNALHRVGWTVAALMASALVAAHVPVRAQTEDPEAYGDGYQSGDYGRVRFTEGGAQILRASSEDQPEERAGGNAPVFPGDAVRTGPQERVEIQLAAGSLVRVDRDSKVTFQSLPSPYAKVRDNTVLLLDRGVVQIAARIGEGDEFRVETAAAAVYLLGDGNFRIESDGEHTRVYSRRGVAEVVGEGGSVLVRGGMRTNAYRGIIPEDPRAFSAYTSDGFDSWVAAREDAYRTQDHVGGEVAAEEIPYEVRPYYRELSSYGEWVEVPEYGRVWYPVGVGAGWRPYWDGYWNYGPGGYFWVSNEPWGWAPYRYGRWNWVGGYGWCWAPGRMFGGAWVSWSWGSAYYGWAPLDYWGYPAHIGGPYHHGYYDPGCWTFLEARHGAVHDVRRHAVPVDRVPGTAIADNRVVARAPNVSPRRYAESRESRERAAREASNAPGMRTRPAEGERASPARLRDVEDRMLRRVNRGTPAVGEPPRAERGGGSERGSQGRVVESPRYPRRTTADPRTSGNLLDRGTSRTQDATAAPRQPRAVDRRSLYDRVSRPRDVSESEARRGTTQARPKVEQREPPQATPRVERRETPRQAPSVQRRQTETPRQAPSVQRRQTETPRQAPSVQRRQTETRREQARPQSRPAAPRPSAPSAPKSAPKSAPSKPKQDSGGKGNRSGR